jgi:hypothetical protein
VGKSQELIEHLLCARFFHVPERQHCSMERTLDIASELVTQLSVTFGPLGF